MVKQTLTFKRTAMLFALTTMCTLGAQAQKILIKGNVADGTGEPLIGATVKVKGDATSGVISDMDGNFQISVPSEKATIEITYIGMEPQTMKVGKKRQFKVVMTDDNALGEVVVVGYGQQKKASVVGSISQTDAKTLNRHAGVTSLGQALTGNLPGVVTFSSTGMPGEEDPKIVIRTQTSINGSNDPLVLVDGVERAMNTVDLSSVESISVLKDASATAVYGVKGGNGVILITTKRGKEGKAAVHVKANATMKVVSKLPEKYDSYDTFRLLNRVVERELNINNESGWGSYKPMAIIDKYRNPANAEEWDRYPNVDWQKELFNNTAMSYNASVDVSGGTKLVKYFAAVDFAHEGDLFKDFTSGRGYKSGFGYNRINMRANLDYSLTKTTQFSTNLFGSNGVRHFPWGKSKASDSSAYWASVYHAAPDAMRPIYSDGTYGYYAPRKADCPNSVMSLARSGVENRTNTQITTDFILTQKLDFVTKGLKFTAKLSFDNTMVEEKRGISDQYMDPQLKWINPDDGSVSYDQGQDYHESVAWTTNGGEVNVKSTYRRLFYLAQLDWNRKFGNHEVGAMGVFNRNESAYGSEFKRYREDWVFRATYNYAMRYMLELNGCYNGSEKFGPDYRFKFFPSASLGWTVTEEPFMKNVKKYVDMFKVRASWGRIGDDSTGDRFLYSDQYSYGGKTYLGGSGWYDSPYTIYQLSRIGNPNVHWETSEKKNLGFDFGFLGGLITGSFDLFKDKRTDVLLTKDNRAIPTYYGMDASVANMGAVDAHGYELSLKVNKVWNKNLRTWGNFNMTHAVNKVKFADDAPLKADYLKKAGYAIGQNHSYIDHGFISNWDDLYAVPTWGSHEGEKYTGDYIISDFNGDGQITSDDKAPYQYTSIPANTFSTTVGAEWKGLSITLQFYGVTDVTREVNFPTFERETHIAFKEGSYYSPTTGGSLSLPRWTTVADDGNAGTRYMYDGSYLRLKNAEIAYTFRGAWVKRIHLNSLRVYLNGDNLLLWTNMPDDRENNFSGNASVGAYPTVRRFNLGFDLTF